MTPALLIAGITAGLVAYLAIGLVVAGLWFRFWEMDEDDDGIIGVPILWPACAALIILMYTAYSLSLLQRPARWLFLSPARWLFRRAAGLPMPEKPAALPAARVVSGGDS